MGNHNKYIIISNLKVKYKVKYNKHTVYDILCRIVSVDSIGYTKFGSKAVVVFIGATVVAFAVDPVAVAVVCFIRAAVGGFSAADFVGVAVDCDGVYIGFDFDLIL